MKASAALISIITVYLLVGCANGGQGFPKEARPSDLKPPSTPESANSGNPSRSHSETQGGGDTGGGNGYGNRVFEAYLIDVTQTEEWTTYLKPLENKFSSFAEAPYTLKSIAKSLRWFVTPVELATLSKKNIGVEFIQDPVQQLALQTDWEVWINDKSFKASSPKDRAILILHEIVMALYRQKFESVQTICRKFQPTQMNCAPSDAGILKFNSVYLEPEPRGELREDDYVNVRKVTDWIFNSLSSVTKYEELRLFLLNHGFDQRFFSKPPVDVNGTKLADWDPSELADLIEETEVTGTFPKHCMIYGEDEKPMENLCSVSGKVTRDIGESGALARWEFGVKLGDKQINVSSLLAKSGAPWIPLRNGANPLFAALAIPDIMVRPEQGKILYLPMLLFSGPRSHPNLVGLNLKPFAITKVTVALSNDEADVYQVNLKSPSLELAPSVFVGPAEYAPYVDYQASFERQVWTFVVSKQPSKKR